MAHLERDHFVVIFLDTRNRILGKQTLYTGTLNAAQVRVAEVFQEAVRRNAGHCIDADPVLNLNAIDGIERM